jgi:polyhydroxyalkanoate synthesis repressor PhaR
MRIVRCSKSKAAEPCEKGSPEVRVAWRLTLLVKKYSNRRLYDTEDSRYITLEELAEKIRAGTDARVIDAKSGEDLTQGTLTQIIIESRGGARLLPVPLLIQLIRLGDVALAEFLGRYLSWALELYLQMKQGAESALPLQPFATLPFTATNALARLLVGSAGWMGAAEPPKEARKAPAAQRAPLPDEIAELRREIDLLKRRTRRSASHR